jgi:hypothetical protein
VGAQIIYEENFQNPTFDSQQFTTSGNVQFTVGGVELQPGSSMYLNAAYAFNDSGSVPLYYTINYGFGSGSDDDGIFDIRMPSGSTSGGNEVENSLNNGSAWSTVRNGGYILYGTSVGLPAALHTPGPYTITAEIWDTANPQNVEVFVNGIEDIIGSAYGPARVLSGASLGFVDAGNSPAFVTSIEVSTSMIPEPNCADLLLLGGGVNLLVRSRFFRASRRNR